MSHVNPWLLAVAFVLGLALTLAFMIRRLKREVPSYGAANFTSKSTVSKSAAEAESEPKTEVISLPAAAATGAVGLAGAAALVGSGEKSGEKLGEGPHGAGSATPETDGSGPTGWTIKGNEESKLYHSPESPSYGVARAEVWFRDVETAEAAGFNRWDSGKSQRGKK